MSLFLYVFVLFVRRLQNLSLKESWDVSCLFASPQGIDLRCSGHPNLHLASSSWASQKQQTMTNFDKAWQTHVRTMCLPCVKLVPSLQNLGLSLQVACWKRSLSGNTARYRWHLRIWPWSLEVWGKGWFLRSWRSEGIVIVEGVADIAQCFSVPWSQVASTR